MKKYLFTMLLALPIIAIVLLSWTVKTVTNTISVSVENVEFSTQTKVTNIGDTYSLDVTIYPENATNKTLVWQSSNESVVMVDQEGNISFVGLGTAYVTATSLDTNQKASCYFVVADTVVHQVLLYTIDDIREVQVGDTLKIYSAVVPTEAVNKVVEYTSSDESVATIDSQGNLTAISAGLVTIIGTSEDGDKVCTMNIEIYDGISSMYLPSYILSEKSFYQLDLNLIPSSADITRINFSVDSDIASVNAYGKVTFSQAGIVNVTASYEDLTQTCEIEYTNGYASSLTLNSSILTLNYFQITKQIEYSTLPVNLYNTSVVFSSSNENVALVSDTGLIQLEGGGACVISVSTQKSDGTYIEKNITLIVTRDANQIVSDDIVTAECSTQIKVSSLPQDSTNSNYYFHADNDIASVSDSGIITFTQVGIVNVSIYANSDYSDVYKTIAVEYTGGYATDFSVVSEIEINAGENVDINPTYFPVNTQNKDLTYTIIFQNCLNGLGDDVISISSNNIITGLKGGTATLQISLQTINDQFITKNVLIEVNQLVTNIEINTDLEMYDNVFVTGNQMVNFSCDIYPLDSNCKDIEYSLDNKDCAYITNQTLIFNYPSTITLTATNIASKISTSVTIQYTLSVLYVEFSVIPTSIIAGEFFDITATKVIPSNLNSDISLQLNSQTTNAKNNVVSILNNRVTGMSGGTCQISVYVGGIFKDSFNLSVIKYAESIDIYPKDITISSSQLNLNYMILPIDSTSNEVIWQIDNENLANISNNLLIFNDYGTVNIIAIVNDENAVSCSFAITRAKTEISGNLSEDENLEMYVGDYVNLDNSNDNMEYNLLNNSGEILSCDANGLMYALSAGTAIVQIVSYNEYGIILNSYNVNVTIYNYIKSFNFINVEYSNGEYITATSENSLAYETTPSQNVKNDFDFILASTTIATIEDNSLIFYSAGVVKLKVISKDETFYKIFSIRYTDGNAYRFNLNVDDEITINKVDSITILASNWVPTNTENLDLTVTLLSSSASCVNLVDNTIYALCGGIAQFMVRFSGVLTRTITVNVLEEINQIYFKENSILTADLTYKLSPVILPLTATLKDVLYFSSNEDIATINDGIVTFSYPGTVIITAYSQSNENVYGELTLTSTCGYPNSITLNANTLNLVVGETFDIYVESYTPSNLSFNLNYDILSDEENSVLSVDSNGHITALSSGTADIKVSVDNEYGIEICSYVNITVIENISDISVIFDENINSVNGVYLTAKSQNNFSVFVLPSGKKTENYTFAISNTGIATIENGTIIFSNTGIVTITFVCVYNSSIQKTIKLNYTDNKAVLVNIDESQFSVVGGVKQASFNAGSTFSFSVLSEEPNNIENRDIQIKLISSSPNEASLPVSTLNNNVIYLNNGGTAKYSLTIDGYFVGYYVFNVIRQASSISIVENVYVSVPYYQILATVLPLDSSDKTLEYSSSDNSVAYVSQDGYVEFLTTGTVQITVQNVSGTLKNFVTINYTRQIQSISVNQTDIVLSVNSTTTLSVSVYPAGIDCVINYVSSDTTIATVNSEGRVITTNKEGKVVIIAFVNGDSQISTSVTITVMKYITSVALKLDSINDDKGIKGEVVFGNKFYSNSNLISTYQMEILSYLPSDATDTFVWLSSDESIATVNESGLVTFLSSGLVTITVKPQNQYNLNKPVYDSYTFKVIDAVNVYNVLQFNVALNQSLPIVFQNNITLNRTTSFYLKNDLYGNGYTLSLPGTYTTENRMCIAKNGLTLDNLTVRGEEMTSSSQLTDLSASNYLMIVYNANDVVFKNCMFENAHTLVRIFGSKILFSGCIFKNAGYAHIALGHSKNDTHQTIATVKNCVFKDAIVSAIMFEFDSSSDDTYASKLIIQENIYIYNFRQQSELMSDSLFARIPEVFRNVARSLDAGSLFGDIAYYYNGKTYFFLGITAIDINYLVGSYLSRGTIDTTNMYPNTYTKYTCSKSFMGVSADIREFTVMPSNTTITPDSTYDSTIYKTIRDLS